jgi:hypothetical protein
LPILSKSGGWADLAEEKVQSNETLEAQLQRTELGNLG